MIMSCFCLFSLQIALHSSIHGAGKGRGRFWALLVLGQRTQGFINLIHQAYFLHADTLRERYKPG